MDTIQYRYYNSQDSLFTALVSGQIDIMDWPLTYSEYTSVIHDPRIQVCATHDADEYELAFNDNLTDGVPANMAIPIPRSPMNFTDFRNAINCLVNKNAVIKGHTLQGFATQCDTQIPTSLMQAYVNPTISGVNYPWNFNLTEALTILYNGGWYNHALYTLASLIDAYSGGGVGDTLRLAPNAAGNSHTVVYPASDPNGQAYWWEPGYVADPKAAADAALANTPIAILQGYVISSDARKDMGDFFTQACLSIGIPVNEIYVPTMTAMRPYVFATQKYDFATLGYTFTAPPTWFYTECTPLGIFPNGQNPYLIRDENMTHYATLMYTDSTAAQYLIDLKNVQDILVMESYLVSVWSTVSFNAYKTGLLGMIDELGYGFGGQVHSQLLEWIFLNCRKIPSGTPDDNIIYYGELNPPDMVNPIFSNNIFDSEIEDEIFTYPMAHNPYTIAVGSSLTGAPLGGDLPWMAYAWNTSLIPDNNGVPNQWTNVTLWLKPGITWQDNVQFTVYDLNYTIWVDALYGDSYASAAARCCCADASNNYMPYFQAESNLECSINVTNPSWLALYTPLLEILPRHLYQYIVPSNMVAAEQGISTDGLHGLWPGQSPSNTPSNFLPVPLGALGYAPYITYANVASPTSVPDYTLIGTGPFTYHPGSTTAASFVPFGRITLDAYARFFLTVPTGAIAFQYHWLDINPNHQPSGGYYRIGLADNALFANACWLTTGTAPPTGGINGVPGNPGCWNPAADIAAPSCVVGLTDLTTLPMHYGWYYGNYTTALGQSLPTAWPATEPNPPYGY